MFDIGFWELVVIAVIGLLVVGPERLPGFAREAGRWIRRVRRLTGDARREIQRELQWDEDDTGKREVDGIKQRLHDMDRLMQEAPDRQPGFEAEYTATGARKQSPSNPDEDGADEAGDSRDDSQTPGGGSAR